MYVAMMCVRGRASIGVCFTSIQRGAREMKGKYEYISLSSWLR